MENDVVRLKRIVSTIMIGKKLPTEIEKIIRTANTDYENAIRKLIEALKTLNLNQYQKEKIIGLENHSESDCKENAETLKFLSLTQYENKKENTLNKLEEILAESDRQNQNKDKSQKTKKVKLNYKQIDNAIKNKQENFNYASELIDNITEEIKSSKKGTLIYVNPIEFSEKQQRKVDKFVKRYEEEVYLIINSTVLKKARIQKALDTQDSEICKELNVALKDYVQNGDRFKIDLDFKNKRNVFIENLYEKVENIMQVEYDEEDTEERQVVEEIEIDEK